MIRFSHQRSTGESLGEYGRGIAGGVMFSLPLLYTMEVWWAGLALHPWRMVIYVVFTFALLLLYNRFAGLRRDASLVEVAIDSVEEMGIGLVLAAAVLWLTGRISGEMDGLENLGKVAMEGMTVAIGVSVGTAQLSTPDEGDGGISGDEANDAYLPQVSLALCGAVLFAANVAPTAEISVIAVESSPEMLLAIALCSILLGTLVLHFADFRGAGRFVAKANFMTNSRSILTTYAVSLLASAALLWFFDQLDGEPLALCVAKTVVLGVPAVLGASAGRLLLQSNHSQKSPS